jgi:murein DD-endopeptidase MepM/ murein hydrolase activator NlpD
MIRTVAAGCVLLALAGGSSASGASRTVLSAAVPSAAAPIAVTYAAPVPEPVRVVRGFEPPSSPYGPGHRGVDLATRPDEVILAAGDATVAFAGSVAGRGVVVLAHQDTVTTEYEPVHPMVHAGQPVARGQPLGLIDGTHGSCTPGGCVHWGARRDGEYFDPMSLLQPLGPVRLLPWTESPTDPGVAR